jgi:hypothetical protein
MRLRKEDTLHNGADDLPKWKAENGGYDNGHRQPKNRKEGTHHFGKRGGGCVNVTRCFPGVVARGYVGNSPSIDSLST